MAARDTQVVITVGKPTVSVDLTEITAGQFYTTGKVTIQIAKGGRPAIGALVFPYSNASNEKDAISQVVNVLEEIVKGLHSLHETLKRG